MIMCTECIDKVHNIYLYTNSVTTKYIKTGSRKTKKRKRNFIILSENSKTEREIDHKNYLVFLECTWNCYEFSSMISSFEY